MVEPEAGERAGKLLADPDIWYPVSALIDGLDPWSDLPIERMKYAVHQRRQMAEALKTQALAIAFVNPEAAEKAMQDYFDVAAPTDPELQAAKLRAKERYLEEVAKMEPIKIGQIRFGDRIGNAPDDGIQTSMAPKQPHSKRRP